MIKRVCDVGKVVTGITPSSRHPEHFGSYLPFITPSDMDGQRRIHAPERRLSGEGAASLGSRIVERAVAVSCIGWQMGKSVLIDTPSVTNQQLNSIVVYEDRADLLFVYYSMLARREEIFRRGSGGSRTPILNKTDFEKLELWVPSLPVQRAVAGLLGVLDDKIEFNRRTNRHIEALAAQLFKSWFVDFDPVVAKREGRMPVGVPAEAIDLFPSHFNESGVPRGWSQKPFAAIVDILGGGTPKTAVPDYWGGEIPWFSIVDAPPPGTVFVDRTEKTITERGLRESAAELLPAGVTIVTARGTVGKLALVARPMAMNQSCYALRGNEGFGRFFVYFSTVELIDDLQMRATGSVFDTIVRATFSAVQTVVPPHPVIAAYETVVSPMMMAILSSIRENATLGRLRDTLLGPLLSGELTLKSAEKAVGAAL